MTCINLSRVCPFFSILLLSAFLFSFDAVNADESSARSAMENANNPLVQVSTSAGNIFLEMLPDEAPENVANFLALAAGEVEIVDPDSGQSLSPNYYDGMTFHRIISDFLIQSGSPDASVFGAPAAMLQDEINADSLGLDRMPAVLADGTFNPILQIGNRQDLEKLLLIPLYRSMGINSNNEVSRRQFEIDEQLRAMSVKQVYENLGYRYTDRFPTRPYGRGTVGLANTGPNSNAAEFFITVNPAEWLNGRYTVIARVIEGMEVVDQISQTPVAQSSGGRATRIYSIREL